MSIVQSRRLFCFRGEKSQNLKVKNKKHYTFRRLYSGIRSLLFSVGQKTNIGSKLANIYNNQLPHWGTRGLLLLFKRCCLYLTRFRESIVSCFFSHHIISIITCISDMRFYFFNIRSVFYPRNSCGLFLKISNHS